MLEVYRRSQDPSYQAAGALLVIKHTISANEIVALIEAYKAEFGEGQARELLGPALYGDHQENRRGPYMCFVEGGNAPKFEHGNQAGALEEAKRLAAKTGRTTHVLRSIAKVVPQTTYRIVE